MSQVAFNFNANTHVGRVRSRNEDHYGTRETRYGYVFIVCDGMGGHAGGDVASKIAVEVILEYMSNGEQDSVIQALHEGIKRANHRIFTEASQNPELSGMGSTCVVLVLSPEDGRLTWAHVGDSRLYGAFDGGLYALTRDHSYVQALVDRGDITRAEMESHPKKNQIIRALGIAQEVKPSVLEKEIYAEENMRFLLCSDGLNGMISDEAIAEVLLLEDLADDAVDDLMTKALNAGGKDNVTVMCVEITKGTLRGSTFDGFEVLVSESAEESNSTFDSPRMSWFRQLTYGIPNQIWVAALSALLIFAGSAYWWIQSDFSEGNGKGEVTLSSEMKSLRSIQVFFDSSATANGKEEQWVFESVEKVLLADREWPQPGRRVRLDLTQSSNDANHNSFSLILDSISGNQLFLQREEGFSPSTSVKYTFVRDTLMVKSDTAVSGNSKGGEIIETKPVTKFDGSSTSREGKNYSSGSSDNKGENQGESRQENDNNKSSANANSVTDNNAASTSNDSHIVDSGDFVEYKKLLWLKKPVNKLRINGNDISELSDSNKKGPVAISRRGPFKLYNQAALELGMCPSGTRYPTGMDWKINTNQALLEELLEGAPVGAFYGEVEPEPQSIEFWYVWAGDNGDWVRISKKDYRVVEAKGDQKGPNFQLIYCVKEKENGQ